MNKSLKWLHLSDLHFNYNNYNSIVMRQSLLKYIRQLQKENGFDMVFITGDIVYQGGKFDKEVEKFIGDILKEARVTAENLYIVPGNHDIVRTNLRKTILEGIASRNSEQAELDKETLEELKKGQKKFNTFYKKIKGEAYPTKNIHSITRNLEYNIININTCVTCGRAEEEGSLRILLKNLQQTLNEVENSKAINIAIGHHSIECFHETERDKIINRLIDNNVDIYLCGHTHKPKYHFDTNNYRELPMFVCGGNMVDDFATVGFISGEIDLSTKKGSVTFHSWNNDYEKWDIDVNLGRKVVNGSLKFQLERFNITEEQIEEDLEIPVGLDEDEFREFIIEFHKAFSGKKHQDFDPQLKDIKEKFSNMKCTQSIKKQYDKFSGYFPIINQIMDNPNYLDGETRLIIPNVIIEEYNKAFDEAESGTKIIEVMTESLFHRYYNVLSCTPQKLKIYLKIIIYWCIHECDIFDDIKE